MDNKPLKKISPLWLYLALQLLMVSCNPLSVPEPPLDYNVAAEVIAVVAPDTVQAGVPFTVKISFPNVCRGVFSQFIYKTDSNKVIITPVIHVNQSQECPAVYSVRTETTQVQLNTAGQYKIVADGRFFRLQKNVEVVSSVTPRPEYTFHFRFQDYDGLTKPNYTVFFSFLDRMPVETLIVKSNGAGVWDTTFADTSAQFRYSIDMIPLKARRGIREDGVLLFP